MRVFRESGSGGGLDPRFAPTQFEIMQRKEVLYPVVDKLKLGVLWAPEGGGTPLNREQAYFRLRKSHQACAKSATRRCLS